MPISPDQLRNTLRDIPWQIGVLLPCGADLTVTNEGTFRVRSGVGILPGIIVSETQSGGPEAWNTIGPDGTRIWAAAIPSLME